ncbi:MAG TPA: LysR family transcriptional regulator [Gemmatimonadaceae bacterium]|nr:LysR family transcriptional regulator [Gemmatimonadaceae bacterium]
MSMHLEVRHLRLVVAIADAGGVTRAGERLFLTQSALSHQLKDIEQRLGSPLFIRAGRRMVLTPAGQRLLEAARSVLAELERTEAEIAANGNGGPTGLLRLTTECYTCYHWLPPVLADFQDAWPRIEVRLVPEATRRPLAALAAGELDLAIVGHRIGEPVPMPPGRRYESTPLFDDELVVISSPSHRLAERTFVSAEDFADESVMLYNIREEDSTLLNEVLRPAGVRPRRISRVELTEAIVELVKAGMGISVMARWAITPYVRAGVLQAIPLTASGFHRRWSAVYRVDGTNDAFLADFAQRIARNAFPARENDRKKQTNGVRPQLVR